MRVRPTVFDLLAFILLVRMTKAVLVNISIDDTYGDLTTGQKPIFQSVEEGTWAHSPCDCLSSPNTSLAFDRTWTAGLAVPGSEIDITFSFTG
jgi:hypothetical protein